MEKISQVVRGSPRVASVDLKSASAVRPGAPSFGRAVGESSFTPGRETSTAARATAIAAQMNERRSSAERVVDEMAERFFMSRMRTPEDVVERSTEAAVSGPVESSGAEEVVAAADEEFEAEPVPTEDSARRARGYMPRGSFIDVRV